MRSMCSISQSVLLIQYMLVELLVFIKEFSQVFCSTSTVVSSSIFLLQITSWVHIAVLLHWSALMSVWMFY